MNLCDCREEHVCLVHELEAEVAALREECEYWREKLPRSARELAEARALLARWRSRYGTGDDIDEDTRAFLDPRRDEARLGETRWNVGAQTFITRDEARRCTCPPPPDKRISVTCPVHFLEHKPRCTCPLDHLPGLYGHLLKCPARDEAQRSSDKPSDGR